MIMHLNYIIGEGQTTKYKLKQQNILAQSYYGFKITYLGKRSKISHYIKIQHSNPNKQTNNSSSIYNNIDEAHAEHIVTFQLKLRLMDWIINCLYHWEQPLLSKQNKEVTQTQLTATQVVILVS